MKTNNTFNNRTLLYIAILSTAIAIGVHIYLTLHYYDITLGVSSGSAICNLSKTLNCDAVAASSFSNLLGVPLALWGATTNAILFLFLAFSVLKLTSSVEHLLRYSFYISAFIAITSLVMGGIALTKLSVYCLFCIIEYVLSFITLAVLYKAQSKNPFQDIISDISYLFQEMRWVGVMIISIIPLSFLFHSMWIDSLGGNKLQQILEDDFANWQASQPNPFTKDGIFEGPDSSFMTIVEFADFRCPHCKHAAPSLRAFASSHPDVQLIFKAFPLDGSCNANSQIPAGDGASCNLAKTVYCSEKVLNKGWVAYDKIFEHQDELRDPSHGAVLDQLLANNQINTAELKSCVQSEETHKSIVNQSQEGMNAKVEGTPTIFVNGKKVKMGQSITMLEKIYIFLKNQNNNKK